MAAPKWDKFYDGTQQQQDAWEVVKNTNEMPWYLALEISVIIIALCALIIFAGGWLKGSRWINKSNPYIKGQVYVRTNMQNIVFRAITVCFALFFISSFLLESVHDVINNVSDSNNRLVNPMPMDNAGRPRGDVDAGGGLDTFMYGTVSYLLSPIAWYFQCFMTAAILGFSLLFKKYKVALFVWPMGLVGAASVFMTMETTLDLGGSFQGYEFQRSLVEHLFILVFPLFIITAQRYTYSMRNAMLSGMYMFILQFGIYILYVVASWTQQDGRIGMNWAGEFRTIAEFIGYDKVWLETHFHLFMWCMLVPFGIACMLAITSIRQFFYFFGSTTPDFDSADMNWFEKTWKTFLFKITHMWKEWGHSIRDFDLQELKHSRFVEFWTRTEKTKKQKFVVFGTAIKEGQIPDDNVYRMQLILDNKQKNNDELNQPKIVEVSKSSTTVITNDKVEQVVVVKKTTRAKKVKNEK